MGESRCTPRISTRPHQVRSRRLVRLGTCAPSIDVLLRQAERSTFCFAIGQMHVLRMLHPISRPFFSSPRLSCVPFSRHHGPCQRLLHLQTRGKPRQLQANPLWLPVPEHMQSTSSLTRCTLLRAFQSGPVTNKSHHSEWPPSTPPPQQQHHAEPQRIPGLRYAGPAAWAILVSAGIFISLAYVEAREQLKPAPSGLRMPAALERYRPQRPSKTPTEVAQQWWKNQDAISKTTIGIIGANTAVHLTRYVLPQFWASLWQIPIRPVNYPLYAIPRVHTLC
jgi:rhomboid-like protein